MTEIEKPTDLEPLVARGADVASIHCSCVGEVLKSFEKKTLFSMAGITAEKDLFAKALLGSETFAASLIQYGGSLKSAQKNGVLSNALEAFGRAQNDICILKTEMDKEVKEKFVAPLEGFLSREVKAAMRMKEKFQKAKRNYDYDITKAHEAEAARSFDPSRIFTTALQVKGSCVEFEVSQDCFIDSLDQVNMKGETDVIDGLKSCISTQIKFFQDCIEKLNSAQGFVEQLKQSSFTQTTEFKRYQQTKTDSRQTLVAQRESTLFDPFVRVISENTNEVISMVGEFNQDQEITETVDRVAKVIVSKGIPHPFIQSSAKEMVAQSRDFSTIFRANSNGMRLLSSYARLMGKEYLKLILLPAIQTLISDPQGYEVDPSRISPGESIERNVANLTALCTCIFEHVMNSTDACPLLLRQICRILKEEVAARYGERCSLISVGGFIFLRFICVYLMAPHPYLIQTPPPPAAARALLLSAKCLQNLANDILFGAKEPHMTVMNSFLEANKPKIMQWFASISDVPLDQHVACISDKLVEQDDLPRLQMLFSGNLRKMQKQPSNYSKEFLVRLINVSAALEHVRENPAFRKMMLRKYNEG
eukprot:TRINITY_DN13896_c0_g1_i1.p1 TRINITY_DN13896_c0_g1~~TRINITY_DN13896_c0_g1_i1.p1  ORF type:complete len:602 (+),score=162.90 TRINITY_DN13896_c0_g1_i1:31-1806(+)